MLVSRMASLGSYHCTYITQTYNLYLLDPLFKLCGYPFTSRYIPLWGHVEGNISNDHSAISIKYIQIIDRMAVF